MKHSASVRALAGALLCVVASPSISSADERSSSRAEALFYEGRDLMQAGRYAEACAKLEESLRLDHGIGTEFNLADCNEQRGKIASAWSGFLRAADAARSKGQAERERIARRRADDLSGRVPKLVIDAPAIAGATVLVDGEALEPDQLVGPIPIDPGPHRVALEAPGRTPYADAFSAAEATTTRVTLPRELPTAVAAATPAPPTPSTTSAPPAPPAPAPPTILFPEPVVERPGSTQRTVGLVVAGLGLASVGVGAGFGLASLEKRDQSRTHCAGDFCDREGVELRDDALRYGDVSTAMVLAGGGALLIGAVLALTAPSGTERPIAASGARLRAIPHVARGGAGLTLSGVMP